MAKIVKNTIGNFLVIWLIFLMMASWIFSGWPQIWQKLAILLSTVLLLTSNFTFAIFRIVNPPRAVFGPCGVLFSENITL
jgi:hypothetical protein